jgi:sensor c-di-GMP phosphodiesterase-like protein
MGPLLSGGAAISAMLLTGIMLQRYQHKKSSRYRQFLRAIRAGEIIPYYQPIIDCVSGKVCGAEVLARWKTKDGLATPERFLSIAESTGLMISMTQALLEQVERDLMVLRFRLPRGFYISVNVSATVAMLAHMRLAFSRFQRGFLRQIHLTLELLEWGSTDTDAELAPLLSQLRETGIKIALDDFNTGHSSPLRLARLPVDIVKIDKSFIDPLTESGPQSSHVDDIIYLAIQQGMAVIAEGVETEFQYRYLLQRGVSLQQGYYWSPPLSAGDFARYLIRNSGE